ncbi:MAG: hypothetical protein ACI9RO_001821 [Alteromonas macleodii]|jgi:hypothetical protein
MYHSPVGQWMAQHAVDERGIGDSLECRAFAVGQRCFWYVPLLADENEKIKDWLIALTKARKNWGGWIVLPVFAQHQVSQMEPQTGSSD